jgi:hypothetical protein
MSSPIITDEEIENESEKELNNDISIDENILKETEEDIKNDIPSSYIEINLVSNGRIKDIPKKLHFRCYSASDAIDLNVGEDDKLKAIIKVLTRLNYEKFDISLLPVQDVLYILYKLHGTFISSSITKKVYIDDTIKDEKLLNDENNLEEVEIPILSMTYAYLGKDYNDVDLEQKIKIPFTIKDNHTKESVSFRYTILKDIILAESYCHNYYKDEFIKFADIRSALNKINSIKDENKQDAMLDKYLTENEDIANEYYEFRIEYIKMVAKLVQAQAIVSYNGKELTTLDEKWEVYKNNISYSIWEKYNKVLESFPFGINEEIDVFLPSKKTKVHRRVGFQYNDFIRIDKHEDTDRCVVEFD